MSKNNKKETEKIVEVNENENLVNKEVEKVNEPTVEAPKMPEFKKLICKQSFTDKFNNKIVYKIGDELDITDVSRRNDLMQRGLAVEE